MPAWVRRGLSLRSVKADAQALAGLINQDLLPLIDLLRRGVNEEVRTVSADADHTPNDRTLLVDASAGPVTISLVQVASAQRRLSVKKIDATGNAVTIAAAAGESLDFASSYVLSAAGESVDLVPDDSQWWSF